LLQRALTWDAFGILSDIPAAPRWIPSPERVDAALDAPVGPNASPIMSREDLLSDDRLEKYRGYLMFLARSHLGERYQGKLDASDIVQQSLLRAHEARQQFQGQSEGEWMAWLRQILVRTVSQTTRDLHAQKRDINRERAIEDAIESSSIRLGQFLAADSLSPSQNMMQAERVLSLAAAIEALPEDQRQVILLKYWQGLSLQELAAAMGRSLPAVAGLLHRATKKLGKLVEP
jgi:RNA polymerase sigma-70 factor, ECF subfamily